VKTQLKLRDMWLKDVQESRRRCSILQVSIAARGHSRFLSHALARARAQHSKPKVAECFHSFTLIFWPPLLLAEFKAHLWIVPLTIAQELQTFIDTANAPIFGIDAHGKVNEWNNKVCAGAVLCFIHSPILGVG
jgi:PAS domain-containing protein